VKKLLTAVVVVVLTGWIAGSADAAPGHHKHKPKPSGIKGVVLNATCAGACQSPPSPEPLYTGSITVTVNRAIDGRQMASRQITDGRFRFRIKPGLYDVTAAVPTPPSCEPTPQTVCPLDEAQPAAIVRPCVEGETKQVQVRRHRMMRVELHVQNICVV
jgi:hypothetical protein